MSKGDATYARGNVDWPHDPLCQAMPDNTCRWLHEVMYRTAVKERSVVIPKKYNTAWFARVVSTDRETVSKEEIQGYIKFLVEVDLIGITEEHLLVVYGSATQHSKMTFKIRDYPKALPKATVLSEDWEWNPQQNQGVSPIPDRTAPVSGEPNSGCGPNEIEIEIEIENDTYIGCPEIAAQPPSSGPPPQPPVSIPAPEASKAEPRPAATEPPAQPAKSVAEPVLVFPCDGTPREWPLTADMLRDYEQTYTTIVVLDACKSARQWLIEDRRRLKTASGMPRFLGNWLRRSVNRGEHKKPRGTPVAASGNGGSAHHPAKDTFVALCHVLALKHPHKTKPEIAAMAEDELQRQRAQDARRRGNGKPEPVGNIVKGAAP